MVETLVITQVNTSLLEIVNSVYLDKADAIVGIPNVDDVGNIIFRFRDGNQVYDATITLKNHLKYVESKTRSDNYIEGKYLINIVPGLMSDSYIQGMLTTVNVRADAKRRRCQRGKPCGDTCIQKGDLCDRSIDTQSHKKITKVRSSLKSSGLIASSGVAVAIGAGALLLNRKNKNTSTTIPSTANSVATIPASVSSPNKINKKQLAKRTALGLGLLGTSYAAVNTAQFLTEPVEVQTLNSSPNPTFGNAAPPGKTSVKLGNGQLRSLSKYGETQRTLSRTQNFIDKSLPVGEQNNSSQVTGGALIQTLPKRQVEVVSVRDATVEEERVFRTSVAGSQLPQAFSRPDKKRRNKTEVIESTGVIVPDPRSKTRSQRGLPAAGEPVLLSINEFVDDKPEDIKRIASKGTIPGKGRVRAAALVRGFDKEDTQRMQDTLNRIDKILPKLSELPSITVEPIAADNPKIDTVQGLYHSSHYLEKNTNKLIDRVPRRIEINPSSELNQTPELTLIHEVGHYLDHTATGTTQELFSSAKARMKKEGEPDPPVTVFDDFYRVVQTTPTTKRFMDKWRKEKDPATKAWLTYTLQNQEVFARAFTQYVATKSNSEIIKKQLKNDQRKEVGKYWSDTEFKTLEPVMDKMFKELGWK